MPIAYTGQQALFPVSLNLGATVAANTEDIWFFFKVPADIPTIQLVMAHWGNGTTITADDTDYVKLALYNVTTSTEMGSVTTQLAATGGTGNVTADIAYAFTPSTTVANRRAVAGDTIQLRKTDPGNGQAVTAQTVVTAWFRVGSDDLQAS